MSTNRRSFLLGVAASTFAIHSKAAEPVWRAKQYHNQPAQSHQHQFLVDLWNAVKVGTDGRVEVTVYPANNNLPGSDPAALELLREGEIEFFTLMGNILGAAVPVMEIQGLPFSFKTSEQVHRANDGMLGEYLSKECAAKGIHRFQFGLLENGFRQISTLNKPIRIADDLGGVKIRVPDGSMFRDLFSTLGAQPVTVNFPNMIAGFKAGTLDGQENPLVVTEVNKLYEYTKYMSITNHMWAGFNLLGNLEFWNKLPAEVQEVINKNVKEFVQKQRQYTQELNKTLEPKLVERGMTFNVADADSFKQKLTGGFYPRWKSQLGTTAWELLENEVGKVG